MNEAATHISERATAMRHEFDRAFAEPLRIDTTARENLLAIRVGEQACAVRLSEIAGLHADKKITRVPGGDPALRGIAGFRGTVLPVYHLHTLLGLQGTPASRWLVIAAAAPVALSFGEFERQLRVSRDDILPQSKRPDLPSYAREFVRTDQFVGPILHMPSVLAAIRTVRAETIQRGELK